MPNPSSQPSGTPSEAVEKAARALRDKDNGPVRVADSPAVFYRVMARTALDAIGYDALVAENERLRRVAQAAQQVADSDYSRHVSIDDPSFDAFTTLDAALAAAAPPGSGQ